MAVRTYTSSSSPQANPANNQILVYVLAAAFLVLGAAALASVGANLFAILNSTAEGETGGTTLLRYLDAYGILLPLITVGAGVYLLMLGVRLFGRDVRAGTWARQILLWLIISSVVLLIQSFTAAPTTSEAIAWALPWLLIGVAAGAGWWWLGQVLRTDERGNTAGVFIGTETLSESSSRSAWNLLLPTLLILLIIALRPLEATFVASLTNERFASNEEAEFVGLDNYARLLGVRFDSIPCERGDDGACVRDADGAITFARPRDVLGEDYADLRFREISGLTLGESRIIFSARDREFMDSISNTLIFTVFSVALELTLGLFIALVINSKFAGRGLMRAAMLVPWAIPTVISARLWEIMFRDNNSGVINNILLNLGIIQQSQAWLAQAELQLPAVIAIDVWKTTPFMALVLLAGLQVISGDLYEAADVDGASKLRQFFSITLPLLRPAIAVALVFRTLDAVRVFDVFQVLFGRGRLSMATYNYDQLVNAQEFGYSAAVGVIIFAFILIFTVIYVRILRINAED